MFDCSSAVCCSLALVSLFGGYSGLMCFVWLCLLFGLIVWLFDWFCYCYFAVFGCDVWLLQIGSRVGCFLGFVFWVLCYAF